MAADEARAHLDAVLKAFVLRLRTRGVAFSTPLLSTKHPMATWSKKRSGR